MQIVIDIPEEIYEEIKTTKSIYRTGAKVLCNAIVNGTPLPKGHGRIADVDKMLDEMRATRTYDILFALERVKPIIEADEVESEDKRR